MAEIPEKKAVVKKEKTPKLADPIAASIDVASQVRCQKRSGSGDLFGFG